MRVAADGRGIDSQHDRSERTWDLTIDATSRKKTSACVGAKLYPTYRQGDRLVEPNLLRTLSVTRLQGCACHSLTGSHRLEPWLMSGGKRSIAETIHDNENTARAK